LVPYLDRRLGALLVSAALLGCPSREGRRSSEDLARPRWSETIDEARITTTLEFRHDLDECRALKRHVHCLGEQKAAAARFHAEIWWHWRHPCGSVVVPDIQIGERVIGVSAKVSGGDTDSEHECVSGFKTVIDPLPSQQWRIVGEDRFDVLLVVPNRVVH
jgi:hypothetical protein